MFLYLVQHAEAKSEQEDPSRGLTMKGLADVKKVADFVSGLDIKVKKICHSGKTRSLQTAQVLADFIQSEDGVAPDKGLAPMDDPGTWSALLEGEKNNMMLVGHLPHLGRLSSSLLCGDREKNLIDFRMGGIVCLKKSGDGAWSLQWMVTPEMVR
jgi:phosphohistidine phosphatase